MAELPQPFTRTDELLVAVHERLGEILDRLPPRQESLPAGAGPVEIREPAAAPVSVSGVTPEIQEPPPDVSWTKTASVRDKPAAKKTAARKRS